MLIGVDGRNLGSGSGTGIATYTRSVLDAVGRDGSAAELLVASPASRLVRYRLAARRAAMPTVLTGPEGWPDPVSRLRVAPEIFRAAQVHFDIWRRLLPVTGPDLPEVMHWTAPLPLRLAGVPNIYTFHDAIPLRRPNRTGTAVARYRRLLRTVAAGASHVIADSAATLHEVLAALPGLAGRITVIPLAVHLPAGALAQDHAALDRIARAQVGCGIGEFYLFCGTIEPRKNVPALIRAFRASHSARRLVLAGPDGFRARDELGDLVGGSVLRPGYLDRDTLAALMRGARALLYPSLAEGFGLPIIEAMASGTPVLTSAGGATEEVAGGAALLIDPADPAALAAAIRRLDTDDALCADLRARGQVRAAAFTPRIFAQRLALLYRQVIGSASSSTRRT